ncbi:MAG: phosphatase PAP2 family protein [Baekduia sp.]
MEVAAAIKTVPRRLAPNGVLDVLRQLALFFAVYYTYRLTRGAIDTPDGAIIAFDNARTLIEIERSTGTFFELQVQQWSSGFQPLMDFAAWIYMNAQTTICFSALVYIYIFHNERYYFVRNMVMVAMIIALVGYVAYPTAPPRFFPEWGFKDTVSAYTGISQQDVKVNALFNPYAAVPSMHCANAIMLGLVLAQIVKSTPARLFWAAYPALMFWVVVVTGNHWVLDAVLGAMTAALSYAAARAMAWSRPTVWAFSPARA